MDKEIKKNAVEHMKKAIEHLNHELATIRTGRASSTLLDTLKVDYFGTISPIKHVASVSVPDAKTISIQPFQPNMLTVIEKAILSSDLGLTPQNDGHLIRLTIPQLTEDRRKDILKIVKKHGEEWVLNRERRAKRTIPNVQIDFKKLRAGIKRMTEKMYHKYGYKTFYEILHS